MGRATYLFQSELPYLVNRSFGDNGYAGYRVGPDIKDHDGFGIGVYSNFLVDAVEVESAIVAPTALVRTQATGCTVVASRRRPSPSEVNRTRSSNRHTLAHARASTPRAGVRTQVCTAAHAASTRDTQLWFPRTT